MAKNQLILALGRMEEALKPKWDKQARHRGGKVYALPIHLQRPLGVPPKRPIPPSVEEAKANAEAAFQEWQTALDRGLFSIELEQRYRNAQERLKIAQGAEAYRAASRGE